MSSKPKVLFVLHLPPPVHGAAMMGKYIQDSKTINEAFDCHFINLATAQSLKDIGVGSVGKLWRNVVLLVNVWRIAHRIKPDLVYITPNACGRAFYKDFVMVWMLKMMHCRVVVHYHNKGVSTYQNHWLDDKLYKYFFCDLKVILLADLLYRDVQKYVKKEDVFICPNGIPTSVIGNIQKQKSNDVTQLLFLSNLLVSKGVLVLLDALKILKDRGYVYQCTFVGGETKEIDAARFLREAEARGVDDVVTYKGCQYGAEKGQSFIDADIFVFPTFYKNEAFSLVLLEAMEYGVACVSTYEGGIPDMIGKCGLLCRQKDVKSLADAIAYLMDNPTERQRIGEEGRKRFHELFTIASFEERFTNIIKEILCSD